MSFYEKCLSMKKEKKKKMLKYCGVKKRGQSVRKEEAKVYKAGVDGLCGGLSAFERGHALLKDGDSNVSICKTTITYINTYKCR